MSESVEQKVERAAKRNRCKLSPQRASELAVMIWLGGCIFHHWLTGNPGWWNYLPLSIIPLGCGRRKGIGWLCAGIMFICAVYRWWTLIGIFLAAITLIWLALRGCARISADPEVPDKSRYPANPFDEPF